jgi:hypothetical protein
VTGARRAPGRDRGVRRPAYIALAAACSLAASCSTDTSTDPGPGAAARAGEQTSGTGRTRIAQGQTGLEVVTWQVVDDRRFNEALRLHEVPSVATLDVMAMRRNGFVTAAVPVARLDALRDALGGSAMDVHVWFGSSPHWRELAAVRIGDAMLEVDGVARERRGTLARLMARTWPVPMEDGTRIAVELVPQLVTDAAQAGLVRNAARLAGGAVTSCAAEVELERGIAWVVTCDPAGWLETDGTHERRTREAAVAQGPPAPATDGEPAEPGTRLATLGAALLLAAPERAGAPARRTVLVLVPHLESSPFPVDTGGVPMQQSSR